MRIYAKKDGILLEDHLQDVENVIYDLWDQYTSSSLKKRLPLWSCMYVAKHHDIGKCSAEFQQICPNNEFPYNKKVENREYKGNHAIYGASVLKHEGIPEDLCEIIAMHHGYTKEAILNEDLYLQHLHYIGNPEPMLDYINHDTLPDPKYTTFSTVEKTLITGMLSTADWIASAGQKIANIKQWSPVDLSFEENFNFSPTPLQKSVLSTIKEKVKGICIYEATMGSGKTEVALQSAQFLAKKYGCNGVLFAMPTRSTTNAMYDRFLAWIKKQNQSVSVSLLNADQKLVESYTSLPLKHLTSINEDTNEAGDEQGIYRGSLMERPQTENSASMVCTTIDHVIKTAYQHKYIPMELYFLAQKVVIIDEVHSYDDYMMTFLKRTLTWLGAMNVPVILLSATLPERTRKALIRAYVNDDHKEIDCINKGYPRLTYTTENNRAIEEAIQVEIPKKEITIKTGKSMESFYPIIEKKIKDGHCVGIIVNNVLQSQKIYREMTAKGIQTILLHSQFVDQDRREKEKWIEHTLGKQSTKESRKGVLFISTQVAEMSLDFDVDYLFTETAPIDRILQRIGRCQRHNKGDCTPVVYVSTKKRKQFTSFYPEELLDKTNKILTENEKVILPDSIPDWIEEGYAGYEGNSKQEDDARIHLLELPDSYFMKLFTKRTGTYIVREGDAIPARLKDSKGKVLGKLTLPYKLSKLDVFKDQNDIILELSENNDIMIDEMRWVYTQEEGLYEEI